MSEANKCPKCGADKDYSLPAGFVFTCKTTRFNGIVTQSHICCENERDAHRDECNALVLRNNELEGNLAKLIGVVRTYCDSPGQVRGEAYRDLAGTLDWLDGASYDRLQGWAQCYEVLLEHYRRACDERDRLQAEVARLEKENTFLRESTATSHSLYRDESKREARAQYEARSLREVLESFVGHYPMGVNPDLDEAYRAARSAIAKAKAHSMDTEQEIR